MHLVFSCRRILIMESLVKVAFMMMTVALSGAVPTILTSEEDISKAQDYLSQYFSEVGVTTSSETWRSGLDSFADTLKIMQEFFGLEVTGQLDTNTMEVMSQPRCGFTDLNRFKYAHFDRQPKWSKNVITYRIIEYTPDLNQRFVDATLAKALQIYSDVVPLDFKQIQTGTADLMIRFKARDHGDFAPFDGQGGVLAHAFSPGAGRGGDTHFDEDETWSLTSSGTNLFLVAAHEFGHALGLSHSNIRSALMYPTYQYVNTEGYVLPDDDKQGVQALYGVRSTKPTSKPAPKPQPEPEPGPTQQPEPGPTQQPEPRPTQQPEPGPTQEPDSCSRNLMFDAATSIRGHLYFFKGRHFWKRSSNWDGVTMREINSVWSGINKVDAAYEYRARGTVFFIEGDHYWQVKRNTVLPGYPKPLSDFGLPASVTKVDAAVHVPFVGRTLFFVNNKYWTFNERRGRMDRRNPKLIRTELPGIGYRVDAAFEYRRYLFFSYGSRQTQYNYLRRRVVRTLMNTDWMDCE